MRKAREKERERKDEKKKEPFENAERSNNASRHKQYVYPKEKLRLTFDKTTRSFFYVNINFLMALAKTKSMCCNLFYDFQRVTIVSFRCSQSLTLHLELYRKFVAKFKRHEYNILKLENFN